jgi:pimeloyl-ACP methyl ester carboxylesterase
MTMPTYTRLVGRIAAVIVLVSLAFTATAAGDTVIDGRIGPGSLYRLFRPTNWNGRLVLYVHGGVAADAPVALPAEGDLIISVAAAQGLAVAFSSFSSNGWDVKDGAQRSHQLLGIFTSKFGLPSRVYVAGASMGGLIAIELAETHPEAFSGALAACAVAGGARRQFDYLGNVRALFDFFYPGVLPGDAGHVPSNLNVTQDIALPAAAAITFSPLNALAIASILQTPLPFASASELGESLVTALVGHAGSLADLIARTHGHPYFDNRSTQYAGALPPALLQAVNAGVERFDATPDALQYLDHFYNPSGRLNLPMLLLSTTRDPVVPGFHRAAYVAAVAANGNADLLVHRQIDRYGHCNFTPIELSMALTDLVLWAELGLKPTP